jgi:catechol 2,3-dioxygenase-like lactoylglutathione lyase family enzyme
MFDKIQHIGYLVADLDAAVDWFSRNFGSENAGGSTLGSGVAVPSGGRNAFVHFGQIEAELIEPNDKTGLPADTLVMHHVGYVVSDINSAARELQGKGLKFASPAPNTNVMGQQVLYFDPATTHGFLIHLTQQPQQPNTVGIGKGVGIDEIVHAGYLVADVEEAVAWYEKNFGGVAMGGIGASRRGARNAYVNFGQVQVELIEALDPDELGGQRYVMDHAGYVVSDITAAIAHCRSRGFRFAGDEANTNRIGQQLLYFDPATTMGTRMHLTQLPAD